MSIVISIITGSDTDGIIIIIIIIIGGMSTCRDMEKILDILGIPIYIYI